MLPHYSILCALGTKIVYCVLIVAPNRGEVLFGKVS
jgi:hypothetical protein